MQIKTEGGFEPREVKEASLNFTKTSSVQRTVQCGGLQACARVPAEAAATLQTTGTKLRINKSPALTLQRHTLRLVEVWLQK